MKDRHKYLKGGLYMKLFNKKLTVGGFIGICGAIFVGLLAWICHAFGLHKTFLNKMAEVKDRIFK